MHVEVSGAVQGVGFRDFTRMAAHRLGVAGWVRNRDDGSVELAAAGEASQIETLLASVRRGPSGAHVRNVRSLPVDEHAVLPMPFTVEG